MTRRLAVVSALGASLLLLGGCREPEVEDVPNRVLDRPSDLALTCMQVVCPLDEDGCHVEARSLNQCANERNECEDYDPGVNGQGKSDGSFHLVGFVANSERNEIAMFTKCSGSLVDMDQETPGYNFISVGALPTDLTNTPDSCRVISSNRATCSVSVLDAESLAGYGLGLPHEGGGAELVEDVEPLRYDQDLDKWVPLAAWPGELISVPSELSHGVSGEGVDPSFFGCAPQKAGSVYMTFPSCGLVAEVDLLSGRLLQSMQFVVDDETGEIEAIDQGQSPECPVDCPSAFDGDVPDFAADHPNTVRPQALALVTPESNRNPYDDASIADELDAVTDNSLYVGGLGSDHVLEIRMDDAGNWIEEDVLDLELEEASGVSRIRASPVVALANDTPYQFLYVITGNGSTRVIQRDFEPTRVVPGRECDTQIDPRERETTGDVYCPTIPDSPGDAPVERRGFAGGPGIQAPVGAKFTDWSFQAYPNIGDSEENDNPGVLGQNHGFYAIGTTNFGGIVFSVIEHDLFDGEPPLEIENEDPVGLFEASLWPHVLFPQVLPVSGGIDWQPLVADADADINLGDDRDPVRHLSPSLRLIDDGYIDANVDESLGFSQKENDETNSLEAIDVDKMGMDEENGVSVGFYENNPVRVAVHDYRSWGSSEWELQWEGEIPGTSSASGRVKCDDPLDHGWADASCLASKPNSSRLLREGGAFCDAGVLPGDKVVLLGCNDDDECGIGQRCLREADAVSQSSGICVSEQAYDQQADYLREVCAEFISDPCGEVYREYLITKSFQDELWLQALDVPVISFLDQYEPCEVGTNNRIITDVDGEEYCDCLPDFVPCTDSEDPAGPECCPMYPGDGVDGEEELDEESADPPTYGRVFEREGRMVCTEEQLDGGCNEHLDCQTLTGEESWCVEGKCMRECEGFGSDDCTYRRLPGPACFSEFVRFRVTAHKSFILRGTGAASFITEAVEIFDRENPPDGAEMPDVGGVPESEVPRHQCVEKTGDATVSQLMTSRIRLPADSEELLEIPICPSEEASPTSPNPCRIAESRSEGADSLFHRMRYEGAAVPALRFSNPVLSIVLDLTNLTRLASEIPESDGEHWPTIFRLFKRSRIPRGYRQGFQTVAGYTALHDGVVLRGSPLTFPTRVVNAPEFGFIYVVDSSGPGSGTSIRGQVMRISLAGNPVLADENFDGVR